MKVLGLVIVVFIVVSLFIVAVIKLTKYSEYKEFLTINVGDVLQQYETVSYEEWMSGSEDVTQNIGNPRKVVNIDNTPNNRVLILEDGTRLTWERYQMYEFQIIKGESK